MERDRTIDRLNVGGSLALGYYRRSGINGDFIRPAKVVRRKPGYREIDPSELIVGSTVTLVIYPETILRDNPWTVHGIVVGNNAEVVTVRQTSPSARKVEGGDFTIPIRYFIDNRVLKQEL